MIRKHLYIKPLEVSFLSKFKKIRLGIITMWVQNIISFQCRKFALVGEQRNMRRRTNLRWEDENFYIYFSGFWCRNKFCRPINDSFATIEVILNNNEMSFMVGYDPFHVLIRMSFPIGFHHEMKLFPLFHFSNSAISLYLSIGRR